MKYYTQKTRKIEKMILVPTKQVEYITEQVEIPFKVLRKTTKWKNALGTEIKVCNLDINHLRNLLNLFHNSSNKNRKYNGYEIASWINIFNDEMRYRKLYVSYKEYCDTYL